MTVAGIITSEHPSEEALNAFLEGHREVVTNGFYLTLILAFLFRRVQPLVKFLRIILIKPPVNQTWLNAKNGFFQRTSDFRYVLL